MLPKRYSFIVADRSSGVMHRFTLAVRPTLALFAAGLRWDVLKRLHQPDPVKGRMKSIYRKSGLHGRDEVLRAILWDVARHAARERGACGALQGG